MSGNEPTDANGSDDFSDSDREWLAALSGQVAPGDARSQAARDGVAMRAVLEQRRQMEREAQWNEVLSDDAMERSMHRLLEQAQAEGLVGAASPEAGATVAPTPPPAPSNVVEFPWWRRRRTFVAMAASVLVGVVALRLVERPDYPEPPIMAGAGGVLPVRAARPRAAADEFANALRAAGLKPGSYQRGRTYIVDVHLMAAELAAAKPAFATLGLEPAVGFNRVEITAP